MRCDFARQRECADKLSRDRCHKTTLGAATFEARGDACTTGNQGTKPTFPAVDDGRGPQREDSGEHDLHIMEGMFLESNNLSQVFLAGVARASVGFAERAAVCSSLG